MEVKAKAKYIRISPRKARLVADVIRGLDVQEALGKLALTNKKASPLIEKLLSSAIANAVHNNQLEKDNLFVKAITVNDGPTYYRWMPRAFGRATQLRKRTSIIDIVVAEKNPTAEKKQDTKKSEIKTEKLDKKVSTKPAEKVEVAKKEASTATEDGKAEEKVELNRKGGYRDNQQQQERTRKEKGAFKKMFRRKSGM